MRFHYLNRMLHFPFYFISTSQTKEKRIFTSNEQGFSFNVVFLLSFYSCVFFCSLDFYVYLLSCYCFCSNAFFLLINIDFDIKHQLTECVIRNNSQEQKYQLIEWFELRMASEFQPTYYKAYGSFLIAIRKPCD